MGWELDTQVAKQYAMVNMVMEVVRESQVCVVVLEVVVLHGVSHRVMVKVNGDGDGDGLQMAGPPQAGGPYVGASGIGVLQALSPATRLLVVLVVVHGVRPLAAHSPLGDVGAAGGGCGPEGYRARRKVHLHVRRVKQGGGGSLTSTRSR